MQQDWAVLLKFSKREHLEQLRNEGLLYIKQFFSTLESDIVRGDRFEGTTHIHQPTDLKNITVTDNVSGKVIVIEPSDLVGPVLIGNDPRCNVYCMFSVGEPMKSFVDARNFGFGNSAVMILNTQEFLNRVTSAASKAGLQVVFRNIENYNADNHSGRTGPFRKPSTFEYQNEFRLAFYPGSDQPIRLTLGSLADITTPILDLAAINETVDFSEESARAAGLSWCRADRT